MTKLAFHPILKIWFLRRYVCLKKGKYETSSQRTILVYSLSPLSSDTCMYVFPVPFCWAVVNPPVFKVILKFLSIFLQVQIIEGNTLN